MYYLVYGSMAGNDGEKWARRLLRSLFGFKLRAQTGCPRRALSAATSEREEAAAARGALQSGGRRARRARRGKTLDSLGPPCGV